MSEEQDFIRCLTKLKLISFKSIQSTATELQKGMNVVIGRNSSGKSNFLQALHYLLRFRRTSPNTFLWDISLVTEKGKKFRWEKIKSIIPSEKSENVPERRGRGRYIDQKIWVDDELIIDSEAQDPSIIYNEHEYNPRDPRLFYLIIRNNKVINYPTILLNFNIPEFLDCLETPLKTSFDLDGDPSFIEMPVSLNIIERLFYLANLQEYSLGEKKLDEEALHGLLQFDPIIKQKIKAVTPIEDFRFRQSPIIYSDEKRTTIENLLVEFRIGSQWMPWSWLSDGTKRLFYIISEVSANEHGIILIEEPELGIHPHQFHLVMNFLKEEGKEKQIIISTHSPRALDYFDDDELSSIIIVNYDKEKGTQVRQLSEKEKKSALKYKKEVGYLSDYWLYSDLEES